MAHTGTMAHKGTPWHTPAPPPSRGFVPWGCAPLKAAASVSGLQDRGCPRPRLCKPVNSRPTSLAGSRELCVSTPTHSLPQERLALPRALPCLCLSPPVVSCQMLALEGLWGRNHGFALDLPVPCTMGPGSAIAAPTCYCHTRK